MILPKAQYEDLMMIKKELGKIARQMGGSVRLALQEAVPRPSGEGCLSLEFTDVNYYTIVNRENVLAELRTWWSRTIRRALSLRLISGKRRSLSIQPMSARRIWL